MNLGEFLENFSDNNVIRLVYKSKTGYSTVLKNWNQVCMDWEVNKGIGKFKDYVNSEVIGIAQISMRNPYADAINIIIKMDKELEEDTKRPPYFELVDKKAESNNTIDLDAYAKGVEDGVIWQAKRMFSEEEVRKLLQVQRGNCYVAILTKTKEHELSLLAISAPEPSGKDGWVKNFNV